MTVLWLAQALIQTAHAVPYPAAVTVLVNQAKRQAFNRIGSFQHDGQADGHGGYAERPREKKKHDAQYKNNHSHAEQEGTYDHSAIQRWKLRSNWRESLADVVLASATVTQRSRLFQVGRTAIL